MRRLNRIEAYSKQTSRGTLLEKEGTESNHNKDAASSGRLNPGSIKKKSEAETDVAGKNDFNIVLIYSK